MKPVLATIAGVCAMVGGGSVLFSQQGAAVRPSPAGRNVSINPGGIRQTLDVKPSPGYELASFGAGCFWGVETFFRETPGVLATAVGYSGGVTRNPTYEQVCHGGTGHVESILIEFDPKVVTYKELLAKFWSWHNPTQGNRQGPDYGAQYRSAVWVFSPEQRADAEASLKEEQRNWNRPITTTIEAAQPFWLAEEYHQQYDAKTGHVCRPPRLYPD